MTDIDLDGLFEATAPDNSVFADKGALDPLATPDAVRGRTAQAETIASLLNGIHEGYLPPTVSVYGPPGTGKTFLTRHLCTEFAARTDGVAAEYINLKECRTIFSVANEILAALTGTKLEAYAGLDGVFEAIWMGLADYPEWTVLILDEIDQLQYDSNYDPNEFFYRLLRGEGKLDRGIRLSVWLVSNELLEVDLRLDSRVESVMSDEQVLFPPYTADELATVLHPRVERAFRDGTLPDAVLRAGCSLAATRWGDARKTLRLFRQAGEHATEQGLETVTVDCLRVVAEEAEREALADTLCSLPVQHFLVLDALTSWTDRRGEIIQPVPTGQLRDSYAKVVGKESRVGDRALRSIVTDLETMGLVDTWMESRGGEGRTRQIETTFDPTVVPAVRDRYIRESPHLENGYREDV